MALSFLLMWVPMMTAMMTPSLVPILRRYRRAGRPTVLVAAGYGFVWTMTGVAVLPLHAMLATAEPLVASAVIVLAGVFQLTPWKATHLAYCRRRPGCGHDLPGDAATAWRHGIGLGLHCSLSCAGLTLILLVIGAMDWWAMALVSAAITLERLAPAGEQLARVTGAGILAAGLLWTARAAGL
jgi:predicted metal-binding membrane protein